MHHCMPPARAVHGVRLAKCFNIDYTMQTGHFLLSESYLYVVGPAALFKYPQLLSYEKATQLQQSKWQQEAEHTHSYLSMLYHLLQQRCCMLCSQCSWQTAELVMLHQYCTCIHHDYLSSSCKMSFLTHSCGASNFNLTA